MYVPPKHAVEVDEAWRIVEEAGAGLLVVAGPEGLRSVFVPVVVSRDRTVIRSHVARANGWWRSVGDGADVLALFLTASAYVSPSYYPSRFENPNVVPTWNYVAAEIHGHATLHDEPQWKSDQVLSVTEKFESGREPMWRAEDLNDHYREQQIRAIVGVEIVVKSIEGKAKMSQNRPDEDRLSVREHLAGRSLTERNTSRLMAPPE